MSKEKQHVPQPPQPAAQQQTFPWEGKPHRLRTVLVSGVVEVTNEAGQLVDLWTAEPFPVHEANIPDALKEIIAERLRLDANKEA